MFLLWYVILWKLLFSSHKKVFPLFYRTLKDLGEHFPLQWKIDICVTYLLSIMTKNIYEYSTYKRKNIDL